MELALDTSTGMAGVAVADRGAVLAEVTWSAGFNHTTQLLPAVQKVLQSAGIGIDDVDAVIVAIGPGSYSGLRVGVSTAKGLAASRGIPLVGVSTLAVEASPFARQDLPIRPLLDAGREEVAVGHYRASEGRLDEVEPPYVTSVELLCDSIRAPTLMCGERLPTVQQAIVERLGDLAVIPPLESLVRQPGRLAELGWRRLACGDSDDPATLQPVYLRAPSITKPRPAAGPRQTRRGS